MHQPTIYYGSDLHLEFERGHKHSIKNIPEGNLLILAGDIFTPWSMDDRTRQVVHSFFNEVSKKFDDVILVLGNHEHYNGYFCNTIETIEEELICYNNIHILNAQFFQFENFLIYGGTFWTDVKNADPLIKWDIQRGMNDYQCVRYSVDSLDLKLRVDDTINENHYARKKLTEFYTIAEEKELIPIVVSHHAPSWQCVQKWYKADVISYGYANTNLDDLFELVPNGIWIHGHMHDVDDIDIGNVSVRANPRGYIGQEAIANNFEFKELIYENQ